MTDYSLEINLPPDFLDWMRDNRIPDADILAIRGDSLYTEDDLTRNWIRDYMDDAEIITALADWRYSWYGDLITSIEGLLDTDRDSGEWYTMEEWESREKALRFAARALTHAKEERDG